MYIPPAFSESDLPTLHEFIERHSFGLLVSQHDGSPFASHLPFLLNRSSGALGTLVGHVARANPQWAQFVGQQVLAVFTGPHSYISPTWYEAEHVVPTWNYVAVHTYGRVRLVEDQAGLFDIVRRSVEVYEQSMPRPWSLGESGTFVDRLLKQIVGFRIEIERIEGKWKLNQNHSVERREKVIRALGERDDENSAAIAALMRQQLGEAQFSDAELLSAFENGTISHKHWNHRAHLRGAYLFVQQFGLDGAITKMRDGLKKLNAVHGSPNTLMRGYHETITVAFLRLIHLRLPGTKSQSSAAFCDAHPELLDKQFLSQFYSQDHLWSWEAKRTFLEPDLKPLDLGPFSETSQP